MKKGKLIDTKVSQLYSYLAILRQGNFEGALHIMGYLKLKYSSRLAFEPSYPDIDQSNFWECDLKDFYEGPVEPIPYNAPLPKTEEVDLFMLIDSNHASNEQTRRSKTRCMIYMNMS